MASSTPCSTQDKTRKTRKTTSIIYSDDEDLLTFAHRAAKAGIIGRDTLDELISLHPKVPKSMAIRYIIQKKRENTMVHLLTEINTPIVAKEDIQLGPEHASEVVELLVNYASKWRLIGIALRFQSQELDYIQASHVSMVDSLKHCLIGLVDDWLQQKHKHTLPPTKNSLQQAMRSETVGLGNIACELEFSKRYHIEDHTLPYSILTVSEDLRSVSATTDVVHTEEGKSVLLEVRCKHQHEWLQNEEKMKTYYPILCIRSDIDMDGYEFICRLQDPTTTRMTITLKVSCSLDQYRQSLVSMYSAMPEVPEDTWPPQSSKKYINLALIKQEVKLNYRNKYERETIRNDLDDVLQHKERIEYDEILSSLKSGQVLFVEGRPGCGKTTFVHKITQDWTITHHGPIRLMLLVSLRVLNLLYLQKPNLDLTDILKLFHKLQVSKEALEEREGRGVCFIFDGLDEFSPRDGNDSLIFKIIKKSYLSESTVIVASRPAAIAKWRSCSNEVIEVLGFLKEQILEYFDGYHFSKELKSIELRKYLLSHPNILHMCYLPIHSAIVAYLYEVIGEIPRTETEIYTHFMRCTLMRSLSKNADVDEEIDVTNLSGNEKRLFNQICELALKKTVKNKQFLQEDEVRESFKYQTSGDISLGLITIDRVAGLYNYKNIYTFLHLTFQEYLAACHISTLSIEEQCELVHEHGGKDHMLVVWKFYCGLMKVDSTGSMFKSVISKTPDRTLHNIQCAYESQGGNACKIVLENTSGTFHFQKEDLTIPDFTALGYVLANNDSSCPVSLSLHRPHHSAGIDALLTETGRRTCTLRELIYTSNIVDDVMLGCLEKLLEISRSLQVLKLSSPQDVRSSLDGISEAITKSCSGLTELTVANIHISPGNLRCVLDRCKHLEKMALHNSIGIHEMIILTDKLKRGCGNNLKVLDLLCDLSIEGIHPVSPCVPLELEAMVLVPATAPGIGVSTTFQLCSCFENMNCIIKERTLNLSLSRQPSTSIETNEGLNTVELINCPREVISACADGIKHIRHLEVLKVSDYYDHNELLEIVENLTHKTLRIVDMNESINYKTITLALFSNLKHCSNLSILNLGGSRIEKEGVECMSFQCWPNLQELNLDGTEFETNIGRSGAKVLANNLDYFHYLSKLHLEYNDIDDKLRLLFFRKLSKKEHFKALYLSHNPVTTKWNRTIRSFDITATLVAQQSSAIQSSAIQSSTTQSSAIQSSTTQSSATQSSATQCCTLM